MKLRRTIAASGMAVSLLAGCAAPEKAPDETPKPSYETSAEAVRDAARQAYSEAKSFWAQEKYGVSILPKLILPVEQEVVLCGPDSISPQKGQEVIALFCSATDEIAVWSEPLAKRLGKIANDDIALNNTVALIVKHEYGHSVQKDYNILGREELRSIIEPQADCLAGVAMHDTNPGAELSAKSYFDGIDASLGRSDTGHGSAERRLANFMLGYASQGNPNCEKVTPLGG